MEGDKKGRTESKQNKERLFFNSSIFCPFPKNCDHCVEQERKNEPTLVLSICFKSNPLQSCPIVQMKDVFVASDQKKILSVVFHSSVAILGFVHFFHLMKSNKNLHQKETFAKNTHENLFCNVLLFLLSLLMAKV